MSATSPPPASGLLAVAGAGAAFAVGAVATLELASLALPGPRGTFRTWGPVTTVVAGGVVVVVGFPASLLVEAVSRRFRDQRRAAAVGYLAAAVLVGFGLWALWRSLIDAAVGPGDLAGEFAILAVGALGIWAGARLAERFSALPVFAFGGGALAAVTLATALLT